MSPLKIIWIINFGIFAHSQLVLPFIPPFFPEHSHDHEGPRFANYKNELNEKFYLPADSKPWPTCQTGSTCGAMYSLESTDWPSGPMIDLVKRKKAGMTQTKPNPPLLKVRNIYELSSLDGLDDVQDSRILKYNFN